MSASLTTTLRSFARNGIKTFGIAFRSYSHSAACNSRARGSAGTTLRYDEPSALSLHSASSGALGMIEYAHLRDCCSCPQCVDPSTTQKLFKTSDIPLDVKVAAVEVDGGHGFRFHWEHDVAGYGAEHVSEFSEQWLKNQVSFAWTESAKTDQFLPLQEPWDVNLIRRRSSPVELDYEEFYTDERCLSKALATLRRHGIVFIGRVPDSADSVERIAERIGVLRDTFYGRTWDVKAKANAENVAYTHQSLGLHMDLLYMAEPPGLQLLHCLRATCSGGESLFCDSFKAAYDLRRSAPSLFDSLCRISVPFRYYNRRQRYYKTHPTIELDATPNQSAAGHSDGPAIKCVNWSPPFQAPFVIEQQQNDLMQTYVRAARKFDQLLNDASMVLERKLDAGTCVVFDNRRVLHARKAFDVGTGERWLRGAYVDNDVWHSRLRGLLPGFDEKWTAD